MLLVALAAQLMMPRSDAGAIWNLFTADDIPVDVVGDGEVRRVGVRVTVDPNGTTRNCEAEFSSGIPRLDSYTCATILKRGHFHPATGADGNPETGVLRSDVTWAVNANAPAPAADLELTVAALPQGIADPAYVDVMFEVDPAGNLSSCTAEQPPRPRRDSSSPELVNVACGQLMKSYRPVPALGPAGKPVRSVQDAVVRFSTKSGGD